MATHGKSINLFFNGRHGKCICEMSNWRVKAYKLPRTMLNECEEHSDL
jgi:hypothetical protein